MDPSRDPAPDTSRDTAKSETKLSVGAIVADRFEIMAVAGSGGMGTVYRARDRSGVFYALKVLKAEGGDSERFEREASILSKLVHPNIVGYVAHGTTREGDPYLAMDWVEGPALKEYLAKTKLTSREAAQVGACVAGALAAAHAKGVIHRDLKPSNLVVVDGKIENVKVLDFGVARLRDLDRDLTRTGQVIGTPGYMAPEQARGERGVDERADLFALGCVLYRCIVGSPAFDGEDVLAVLTLLVLHDPPRVGELVGGVPAALDELVFKLLEKEKDRRPPDAATVAAELARIAALPDSDYQSAARGVQPRPARTYEIGAKTEVGAGRTLDDLSGRRAPNTGSGARGTTFAPEATVVSARPKNRRIVWIGLAVVLLGAAAAVAILLARRQKSLDQMANDVATARCRDWTPVLMGKRDSNDEYGLEAGRAPGAWETAQALFALGTAWARCDAEGSSRVMDLVHAISTLKRPGGWFSASKEGSTIIASAATAYVTIGLNSALRSHDTPELQAQVAEARALLLRFQNAAGGFRASNESTFEEEDYSTMMAAWALSQTAWLDPIVPAQDARKKAINRLRDYLENGGGDPRVDRIAGYEEQTAWVILQDRRNGGEKSERDKAIFAKVVKDILLRCAKPSDGSVVCRDANLSANSHLDPSPTDYFTTFWLPWVTLLSFDLSHDTELGLSRETKDNLAEIARWGLDAMDRAQVGGFTAIYQISEYLFAVSSIGKGLPPIKLAPGVQVPALTLTPIPALPKPSASASGAPSASVAPAASSEPPPPAKTAPPAPPQFGGAKPDPFTQFGGGRY